MEAGMRPSAWIGSVVVASVVLACAGPGATGDDVPVVDTEVEVVDSEGDTAFDSGLDTAPDLPGCQALVRLSHGGDPLVDFALPIEVDVDLDGADADLGNLRVLDAEGEPLPRWVESAQAGSGRVWVRASVPYGLSFLRLDTCGDTIGAGAPGDVFPLVESFDGEEVALPTCGVADADELCETRLDAWQEEPIATIALVGSCAEGAVEGVSGTWTRTVELPAGRFRLDFLTRLVGAQLASCGDDTVIAVDAVFDGAPVGGASCPFTGCTFCDRQWQDAVTDVVELEAGVHDVGVRALAGPCARALVELDDLRLVQVADPAPKVTILGR